MLDEHTSEQQSEQETKIPDAAVMPKAKRRKFTAKYKLRIVKEADAWTTATMTWISPSNNPGMHKLRAG